LNSVKKFAFFISINFALFVSSFAYASWQFTTRAVIPGSLELVDNPSDIDIDASRRILVASFSTEYAKYLTPEEISPELKYWKTTEGQPSVEQYYEYYFEEELGELTTKKVIWLQAKVEGKLVGWVTFCPEYERQNALYMNLLVVDPLMQGQGIGKELVFSLVSMGIFPETQSIHLLLRKKNQGGRIFYGKLGFFFDPSYQRKENFVDLSLLEPWSIILPTEE
jgi:ribosomal protein S18 acetylase RimI-like enzyme